MSANTERSEPRTAAALAARQRGTQAALDRIHDAITRLHRDKAPVSVAAVARRAAVSRTFLYTNPDAKTAIAQAITQEHKRANGFASRHDEQQEATWRERALNAEDALKAANAEILTQRGRIGELLGRIRDLEAQWTQDAIQRVTTENTTLKQRLQQLSADNRTLDERLKAARSNLRFQDRRIADLEAQLAPPEHMAAGQRSSEGKPTTRRTPSAPTDRR
jgi:chromosome segregation ATPase